MRFSKKLPRNPIKRRRYRLELGGVIPGVGNQDAGDGVSNEELMAMLKGLKPDAAPPLSLDPAVDVGEDLAPITAHQEMLNESKLQANIENTVSKIPIAKQFMKLGKWGKDKIAGTYKWDDNLSEEENLAGQEKRERFGAAIFSPHELFMKKEKKKKEEQQASKKGRLGMKVIRR
jgi:hypothetical protein